MKKLLALLLLNIGIALAQNSNLITVIPTTNPTTGAPSAAGILSFRDLDPTAPHSVQFVAPARVTPSILKFTLPASNPAGGIFCVDTMNVITVCAGGGGAPFIDTTAIIYDAGDPTKLIKISAAGLPTATTYTLTPQNANYILAGTNLTNTFTVDQNWGSVASINMNGTLVLRFDRTLWNLGDFNTHITFAVDNNWNIGTAAHRVGVVTSANFVSPTAASATTGCTLAGHNLTCHDTGNTASVFVANDSDTNTCSFYGDGIQCLQNIGFPSVQFQVFGTTGNALVKNLMTAGSFQALGVGGAGNRPLCTDNSGTFFSTGCTVGSITNVTATNPIFSSGGTTPNITCPFCAVTNVTNTFTADQNWNLASINMSGVLTIRYDRTVWNLGDFNTHITFAIDNNWNIGTSLKRVQTIETTNENVRTGAGATTGCFTNNSKVQCNNVSNIAAVVMANNTNTNTCSMYGDGLQCLTNIGFPDNKFQVDTTAGTLFVKNNVTAKSFNGKMFNGGFATFSGGSFAVTTGFTSGVFGTCSIYTGGGGTLETCNVGSTSGGVITFKSSNSGSGSVFNWTAVGVP